MSEYRHFIAYVYEYKNGKKGSHAGVVKTDARNGGVRMQLRLKTDEKDKSMIEIYGFVRNGEWLHAVKFGEGQSDSGICEKRLLVSELTLKKAGYTFPEISGLWMQSNHGSQYLTVWDDLPVNMEKLVTEIPKKAQLQEEKELVEESEDLHAEDINEVKEIPWEQYQYHYPHAVPFEDDEITDCVRIAPKDITFLGSQEKYFCKNPFVQQKYMKYHHLLLGRHQNGKYILAVPGIKRNEQDQHLAQMYGFPEYKEAKGEVPGYWYHFL